MKHIEHNMPFQVLKMEHYSDGGQKLLLASSTKKQPTVGQTFVFCIEVHRHLYFMCLLSFNRQV